MLKFVQDVNALVEKLGLSHYVQSINLSLTFSFHFYFLIKHIGKRYTVTNVNLANLKGKIGITAKQINKLLQRKQF